MKLPRVGQRVSADSHNGVFIVVRVDETQHVADLELTTGTRFVEKGIPFNAIKPIPEDVNQAAARIVGEATEEL